LAELVSEAYFSEVFPSDFESMAAAIERTVLAMRAHGNMDAVAESRIRLCIEEALVNAIRHGNQCDPSRSVLIAAAEEDGLYAIRVCDEGRGFHPGCITVPEAERLGGRGLCLIRHYMDEVEFIPDEGCLVMRFRPGVMKEGD
jgi:serine/threonine-protein kinase RsbW